MNIVLVMDQYDNSSNGTTVTARRLAENLRAAGHTVTILAAGRPEANKICAQKHRIPIFQGLIESQGMSFAKPDPALYYEAFRDADIVHFFMPFRFCRQGEKHARQMRVPTVAGFHIQPENITSTLFLEKSRALSDWMYRWFYRKFYCRFGHIHCPSQFIATQLEEHGYDAEIHPISNGVSRFFERVETEKPAEWQDKFTILMVGRYSREKRQDLLIQAAQKSKYAGKIQLVFAGKGPCRRKYERMGKKLPNAPVMKFMPQDELLKTMNSCDLYVHASDAEAEGISCLEALACGLVPVISNSRLSATWQYALCPESLFEAGDAGDLAAKIDYWIEHPGRKAELSVQYMAQQEENRVDICAEKMVQLYETVLADSRHIRFGEDEAARPLTPDAGKLDSRLAAAHGLPRRITHWLANLVSVLLAPVNQGLLGLRIRGRRHLKGLDGAVTVCNHVHPLDSTMIKAGLLGRRFWVVSLRENFNLPVVGGLIKSLGAVPLGNSARTQGELNRLLAQRLEEGDFVHFFPEGMLVPYHDGLREMHAGAFALAVQTGRPVVPMVLCPRKKRGLYRLKRKPCLTLKILQPIYPPEGATPRKARAKLQRQTEFVMRAHLPQQGPKPRHNALPAPPVYPEGLAYETAEDSREYLA